MIPMKAAYRMVSNRNDYYYYIAQIVLISSALQQANFTDLALFLF